MTFHVLKDLTLETTAGILDFTAGQLVRLDNREAEELIQAGYVQPYCYWQDRVIENCQLPCYKITPEKVVTECSHFSEYWQSLRVNF